MTIEQISVRLVETNVDPIVKTYFDRLLLRIFQTPSLMASLLDCQVLERDSDHVIQLDFKKLPEEIVHQVKRVVGSNNVRMLEFDHEGAAHTGMEIYITAQELERAKGKFKL